MSEEIEVEIPRLCPVAEYMGVCILEGAGDQKTSFKGVDYTTDGKCYLIAEGDSPEMRQIIIVPPQDGLTAERAAKNLIEDNHANTPYMTYEAVLIMLQQFKALAEYKTWIANGGRFEWDENEGMFVRFPPMFGQGKAKHDF